MSLTDLGKGNNHRQPVLGFHMGEGNYQALTHANHPTPHSGEKKHPRNTYEVLRLEAQTHLETEAQSQAQGNLPSTIPCHHINKGLLTAIHLPFT